MKSKIIMFVFMIGLLVWGCDTGTTQSSGATGSTATTILGPVQEVSVSSLSEYLSDLSADGGPYNIQITDTSPDLAVIGQALRDNSSIRLYLDLSKATDLTEIGSSAFEECSGVTSVMIPDSVTSIGAFAFYGCSGLTSITIPNSVTSIGSCAFGGCKGLTSISVDPNNTIFDSRDNCNAIIETATNTLISGCKNTVIPNSVTSIGSSAFSRHSTLTNIIIPNSVTSIGRHAFECSGITNITIPDSVTSIDSRAFQKCDGLNSITIPNSVTSIGNDAFYGCSSLRRVYYTGTIADWCSLTFGDGETTSIGYDRANPLRNENAKLYIDGNLVTSLEIPNTVTEIKDYVFQGCSSLNSVTIPNSVTSIGRNAFEDCIGLTRVDYTGTIADWCGITFNSAQSNPLSYAHNLYINDMLVENNLIIPNTVVEIKPYAFSGCSGLTSIEIPDSVTGIGKSAFSGCSGLTSIEIPDSVTGIGGYAFAGCRRLTSITIPFVGDRPHVPTDTWQYPFGYIFGQSSYGGGTDTKQSYYGNSTSYTRSDTYYIPTSLKSVSITGSSYIPHWAFHNCSGLTSVTIGNSVTSIGEHAFAGCSGLTSVTIGNSVTSIGEYAFGGCSGLTNMTIKATTPPPRSELNRFSTDYSVLTAIYVPSESVEAYKTANGWKDYADIIQAITE